MAVHFERADSQPLSSEAPASIQPKSFGVTAEGTYDKATARLGVLVTVNLEFDLVPPPVDLVAEFRIKYRVTQPDRLTEHSLTQFISYNAVHNVWPYWREFLTSITNRAQLPRLVVPLLRMPDPPRDVTPTAEEA